MQSQKNSITLKKTKDKLPNTVNEKVSIEAILYRADSPSQSFGELHAFITFFKTYFHTSLC